VREVFSPSSVRGFVVGVIWLIPTSISIALLNAAVGYWQFFKKAYKEESGVGRVFSPCIYLAWLTMLPFLSIIGLVLVEVHYLPKFCLWAIFPATIIFLLQGMKHREP
jgi:hypothetical protein